MTSEIASILSSDVILLLTFIITAAITAFILGKQEPKPRGSLVTVYVLSLVLGLFIAGVVAVIQYMTENIADTTLIKVAIFLVGVILIAIAGIIGRKLNRK